MPRRAAKTPPETLAYEGVVCYVSPGRRANHTPIYHASDGRDHFYTDDKAEYDRLPDSYEKKGISFYVARRKTDGNVPLYRLYCKRADDHFYLASADARGARVKRRRYKADGILGYVMTTEDARHVAFMRAWNPQKRQHFYTTNVGEIDNRNQKLTGGQLRRLLKRQLRGHLSKARRYHFADYAYFCPTRDAAQAIIDKSGIDGLRYQDEDLDCDDFAHLLKSAFIKDACHGDIRSMPYAFGVIWGEAPMTHAWNVIVISNGRRHSVWLVEPQRGTLYRPTRQTHGNIRLVIM
ncbi:MAG: hypothetical protein FJW34_13660 [Acidobacteria bacterium]|nr:hypothetical protein [Acidobacteriota bacterium]